MARKCYGKEAGKGVRKKKKFQVAASNGTTEEQVY